MEFTDTHTHLYVKQFKDDLDAVIRRAVERKVTNFYLPNIDSSSIEDMLAVERAYPDQCFAMMGLHPCSVGKNYLEELETVRHWLFQRHFCAVGEIGIDLYWDKTFIEEQKEAFLTQIDWAKELELPIVIHSRESIDLIIAMLREVQDDQLHGIFHCFGGTLQQAREIIELGFYLGIGGVLTYKKSGLDKTLQEIDLRHIVLETDSPYLAPVPYRGKRNESAYIADIAQRLAEVKSVAIEEVARITTANAINVFKKTVPAE